MLITHATQTFQQLDILSDRLESWWFLNAGFLPGRAVHSQNVKVFSATFQDVSIHVQAATGLKVDNFCDCQAYTVVGVLRDVLGWT